jgi:hypothetical protein
MQRFTQQIVFVTTIFFFTGMPTLVLHAQELGAGQTPPAQAQRAANAPALVPVKLNVDGNFRISPPYATDPAFVEKPNVPKGRVIRFLMNSAESKIFPTAPVGGAGRGQRAAGAVTSPPAANCSASGAADSSNVRSSDRGLRSGGVHSEHAGAVHRGPGRALVYQRGRGNRTGRTTAHRTGVHPRDAGQPYLKT